ncbi:MAG: hypothetical protein JO262_22610 [Solirubrobacterales bacterium]|nr:hypothetical protein [Solirubrobacterales bacterium]MBV9944935.1 hypothetical protein [Solirubrobacterales bacterium]
MSKRLSSLIATAAVIAVTAALAFAGGAGAASSLPTLNIALTGTTGVSVSGSTVSGAVNVSSTFSGKAPSGPNSNGPTWGLVRLNPGASILQAVAAVQSHHGDINALTPYGSLFADGSASGTVQTALSPGNYVALNITGNGNPALAPFTVTQSSSPAALPAAANTQIAIEFGFRGPTVLRDGTIVRAQNAGYLVHMVIAFGVKNPATGRQVMALLRAGKDGKAQKLINRQFITLAGPISPGGMQQQVLHTKPGYYVEACFMDTQDHREHTQLGMMRLIRVVK